MAGRYSVQTQAQPRMMYGGHGATWKTEASARDALFDDGSHGRTDGGYGYNVTSHAGSPSSYGAHTNEQLQAAALAKHKDTTDATARCKEIVNNTIQVGQATLEELESQGRQLESVNKDLGKVKEDVKFAKRVIRHMRLGPCVQFCLGLFTEPEEPVAPKANPIRHGPVSRRPVPPGPDPLKQTPAMPGIDTTGLPSAMREEIAKQDAQQDKNLDDVAHGLGVLGEMARNLNEELKRQDPLIKGLDDQMPKVRDMLKDAQRQAKRV